MLHRYDLDKNPLPISKENYKILVDRKIDEEEGNLMEYNTACFTGHRGINSYVKEAILELIKMASEQGVREFLSGMAFGTDLMAAEVLTERQLCWTAVLPCPAEEQTLKWAGVYKAVHARLLGEAHKQILLSEHYTDDCMANRNRYMVDNSELCLGVWDGRRNGGTYQTLRYARSIKKLIYVYDPNQRNFFVYD